MADFRNIHAGATIVVCGCGTSLLDLPDPETLITIGVNDVGRLFHPTYLVVLNPRQQFAPGRFTYVEQSRARAIFTQLDLGIAHPNIVRIKLGARGSMELSDPATLPCTRNSPYVAVCLAIRMGASRVGLIGVDFTQDHFFGTTGRHPLSHDLARIDREYGRLARAAAEHGTQLVNLSSRSRLVSLPKVEMRAFLDGRDPASPAVPRTSQEISMNVAIQRHSPGVVGDFLNALADGARRAGIAVSRPVHQLAIDRHDVTIVWNGRHHRGRGPTIFCEHGWLPRWSYQVSPRGINADSHLAPFHWNGVPLDAEHSAALDARLDEIRRGAPGGSGYMQTSAAAATMPRDFLLVPLQIEADTNIIRHAPPSLRRMQALIDHVSAADPPFPLVFKQHPADLRRGNRHLRLRPRRRQDELWAHGRGNVHQLLKSGRCRGVITINSNVVHDALLWDVPAVVLGENVWPREGDTPFLTELPANWAELNTQITDVRIRACRRAYAWYLIDNQWDLHDAQNADKVRALLRGVRHERPQTLPSVTFIRRPSSVVNVVAVNKGGFFEELKRDFSRVARGRETVVVSERARRDADAWIFVRTREAAESPDPSRTLVQIHDLYDGGRYARGGERAAVADCAAIALTHPMQLGILTAAGIDAAAKAVVSGPIGAPGGFRPRSALPAMFTVAWIGRPEVHDGRDVRRLDWFIEAVSGLPGPLHVALVGDRLMPAYRLLKRRGVRVTCYGRGRAMPAYPVLFHGFDAVAITSETDAGPQSLFEALAAGVPVISTAVGWAPDFIRSDETGYLVGSISDLREAIVRVRQERATWLTRSGALHAAVAAHSLDRWVERNLRIATNLGRGADRHIA